MPGVPSGRGCDGCRKQRKKVMRITVLRALYLTEIVLSATRESQHALAVHVLAMSALVLVNNVLDGMFKILIRWRMGVYR